MKPVEIGERPFVLEALVFLERVRGLTDKGLEATGGPMGKTGEIFDLLDAVCDAFDPEMQKALGLEALGRNVEGHSGCRETHGSSICRSPRKPFRL